MVEVLDVLLELLDIYPELDAYASNMKITLGGSDQNRGDVCATADGGDGRTSPSSVYLTLR